MDLGAGWSWEFRTIIDEEPGATRREMDPIGTLVAFSGSITDLEYGIEDATEASMNLGGG